MSRQTKRLGDVAEFIRGITFKPEDVIGADNHDAVVCMRTKNIQEKLEVDDVIAVPDTFVRRDELFLRRGDILISSANSSNLVGKVAQVLELPYRATAGGFIAIVRAKPGKIDSDYLYRWLASDPTQATVRACGRQTTNISNLSVPRFLDLSIVVPEPHDQERIASILDKVDSLRRKRHEAIRLTAELVRSKFLEMFGEPSRNVKGLPTTSLGELVKLKSGNFLPSHEMAGTGGVSVYGGNGVNGEHDTAMFNEVKLVIGRVGAYCGAVHLTKPLSWITDNALYVSEISPLVRLEYLAFALTQANLNQYSSQSGQPLVSASRLYPVMLGLPPLNFQDAFLEILEHTRHIQGSHLSALLEIEKMSQSLIAELFTNG